MNVLHLNRFIYSSQTRQVFSLVREQRNQGINAQLIMDGNPTYQTLSRHKQALSELDARMIRSGDVGALEKYAQEFLPTLIHAHCSSTFSLACNLARKLQVPFVISCYEPGLNRQEYQDSLQGAAAIFCTSTNIANKLKKFSTKVKVLPHAVDLQEFKPGEKNDPLKIVLFSQVDPAKQKAYHHFCKATDLLEGVKFYVASNKKPQSSTAIFLGWPDDVADLLASSDIVVGTGRVAIEALAAGNAVLILGQTFQGLLQPEKAASQKIPDVSGLTGSDPCYKNIFYDLAKLTQNQIYLRQLQQQGRKLAEKEFCNTKVTRRIINEYQMC
ncbi:glycosyltransferase family 4 protein [Dethiobacter alkaliphilus]|uniref:glycosyltransferase family 4 protein n=1 Tax=Dethiobacter alkaliphilus TaxID=427926 RepID=UPI0022280915|nr:glycosyltransferase family 4 protein [Dethiobacter alkaliphilus]MCW3489199.1 glycosyltransferase family 4 protein [Dethiobacter alkaliphilus]